MLKQTCLLFAFSFLSLCLFAQEQLGIRTGNFSGVNSILLNPSLGVQSPLNWDINLMTGHFFAETDYAFIRNTNFFHLMRNKDRVTTITDLYNPVDSIADMPLYFDTNGGMKRASILGSAMGPSAIFKISDHVKAGFLMRFRMQASAQDIPENLGYYELKDFPLSITDSGDTTDIMLAPTRIAAMSWAEVGLHLSWTLFNHSYTNAAVGVNFKYLVGFDGAFARNDEAIVFNKLGAGQYLFRNTEAELGFTTTALDSSSLEFKSNGGGIAFDLGFSFKNEKGYWGVSLLDLGFIRFRKNVEVHHYSSDALENVLDLNYNDLQEYSELINQLSADFPEVDLDSLTRSARPFTIWLPTALSVQMERHLGRKIYLNAGVVHRLPFGKNRVERDNLLYAAPRFETRMVSFYLPVSLYDFKEWHIGFAARVGIFTVGSDNVFSLIGKSDFRGTDIYASIKVNPFQSSGVKGKMNECFYFDSQF